MLYINIIYSIYSIECMVNSIYIVYKVYSTIISPGSQVSDFAGNLRARKLNKGTDKTNEHNWRTVFFQDLVLRMRASTEVVSTSSHNLSSIFITLPHNFLHIPFLPPPPPLPDYASTTDRIHRLLGSGGHA